MKTKMFHRCFALCLAATMLFSPVATFAKNTTTADISKTKLLKDTKSINLQEINELIQDKVTLGKEVDVISEIPELQVQEKILTKKGTENRSLARTAPLEMIHKAWNSNTVPFDKQVMTATDDVNIYWNQFSDGKSFKPEYDFLGSGFGSLPVKLFPKNPTSDGNYLEYVNEGNVDDFAGSLMPHQYYADLEENQTVTIFNSEYVRTLVVKELGTEYDLCFDSGGGSYGNNFSPEAYEPTKEYGMITEKTFGMEKNIFYLTLPEGEYYILQMPFNEHPVKPNEVDKLNPLYHYAFYIGGALPIQKGINLPINFGGVYWYDEGDKTLTSDIVNLKLIKGTSEMPEALVDKVADDGLAIASHYELKDVRIESLRRTGQANNITYSYVLPSDSTNQKHVLAPNENDSLKDDTDDTDNIGTLFGDWKFYYTIAWETGSNHKKSSSSKGELFIDYFVPFGLGLSALEDVKIDPVPDQILFPEPDLTNIPQPDPNTSLTAPMVGWNVSESSFATDSPYIDKVKAIAKYMSPLASEISSPSNPYKPPNGPPYMKDSGYNYVNLSADWWTGSVDNNGRAIPTTSGFFRTNAPSAGITDFLSGRELKLGLRVSRGIPRSAVTKNYMVLKDAVTAVDKAYPTVGVKQLSVSQISNLKDTCAESDLYYGMNWKTSQYASLAYYVSLFQLWESWGIDLVVIDDLIDCSNNDSTNNDGSYNVSPNVHYHKRDIDGYIKAKQIAGSDIIISGLPGGGLPSDHTDDIIDQLDTMHISTSEGDTWEKVNALFDPAAYYAPEVLNKKGKFFDLGPLPFHAIKENTDNASPTSGLTKDEMITSMTLHLIARSPIMIDAVFQVITKTNLGIFMRKMLNNKEALEVNQTGTNQKCFYNSDGITKWVSDAKDGSKYVALFNRTEDAQNVSFKFADPLIKLSSDDIYMVKDIWNNSSFSPYYSIQSEHEINIPAHGAVLYQVTAMPMLDLSTPSKSLYAGEDNSITTTVKNFGPKVANNIDVKLEVPTGWTVTPKGESKIATLEVNGSRTIEWEITIPTEETNTSKIITTVEFNENSQSSPKQIETQMAIVQAASIEGFYDDFSTDRTNRWTDSDEGTWQLLNEGENKILKPIASETGDGESYEYQTNVANKTWKNAVYEFDVRYDGEAQNNTDEFTLMFRKDTQEGNSDSVGYALKWSNNKTITLYKNGEILGQPVVNDKLLFNSTPGITDDWRHLMIANKDGKIQVFIDNETTPILSLDDTENPNKLGYVSIGCNGSAWSFDNFAIRLDGDLMKTSGTYINNPELATDSENKIEVPILLFDKNVSKIKILSQTETSPVEQTVEYTISGSEFIKKHLINIESLPELAVGSYTLQIIFGDGDVKEYALTVVSESDAVGVLTETEGTYYIEAMSEFKIPINPDEKSVTGIRLMDGNGVYKESLQTGVDYRIEGRDEDIDDCILDENLMKRLAAGTYKVRISLSDWKTAEYTLHVVSKSEILSEKIMYIDGLNTTNGQYTTASVTEYTVEYDKHYQAAKNMVETDNATIEALNSMIAELENMISILVPATYHVNVEADPNIGGEVSGNGHFEQGDTVILDAQEASGYDFEGWYIGNEKVELAGANYQFEVTSSTETTVTYTAKFLEVNRSALDREIEAAKKLIESDYTSQTWDNLTSVLTEVEKITADSSQSDVNAAENALHTAINSLVSIKELRNAIETATKLISSNYTVETSKRLNNALTSSNTLINSSNASVKRHFSICKNCKLLSVYWV
jgi:hypothetical protein